GLRVTFGERFGHARLRFEVRADGDELSPSLNRRSTRRRVAGNPAFFGEM
ncbi:MAG: hypothetical protein ACI8WY_001915, partial [Planctomycetota bacterium]